MTTKLPIFPTLANSIKNAFKETYQSFAFSTVTSVISAICSSPIFLIVYATFIFIGNSTKNNIPPSELFQTLIMGLILCGVWNTIVVAPITTAFYCLYQTKKEGYPSFKIFINLLLKHYRASFTVNGLYSLALILLFINILIAMMERTMFFFIIGMFSFYLLIFLVLMSFFFAPLIHLNNSIKKTLKKAFLLVMDNTLMTVLLILFLGVFFVIAIALPIIWFIVFGAILVYVTDLGFYAIYNRYDD
ncbi:MAG: hypothetical protein GXY86_11525 [Firmicutes bacterium]|nr:hypothetical protein [Bacillota bacterium]